MASKISFKQEGVNEVYTFTPKGKTIVQVKRDKIGFFTIYGQIGGMEYAAISQLPNWKDIIFCLNLPSGVSVKMVSGSHVTEAKIQVVDE